MKIVLGSTSLAMQAEKQYLALGYKVCRYDTVPDSLDGCDELFVAFPMTCEDCFSSDSETVSSLLPLLKTYNLGANSGKKLLCQLLLYSSTSLHAFRAKGLNDDLKDKVELWPFTAEELSARNITFDRSPIQLESDSTVHLVLFGLNEWTDSVIREAALVCHYPNYTRDHTLRTRITIIDEDLDTDCVTILSKYRNLFGNSYVRMVDVAAAKSKVSRPVYARREDFVDIEWELVKAAADDECVLEKISDWCSDPMQQLTVVVCCGDDEMNMTVADRISEYMQSDSSRLYVAVTDSGVFDALSHPKHVMPLCLSVKTDVTLPLRRMAMIVNYVYSECYHSPSEDVRIPLEIDYAKAEKLWNEISDAPIRWSNVCNAMSIKSKMHSLGHDESDWDTFYSVNAREIETLAEVEHNRWSVEKLLFGFRPLTDGEQKVVMADAFLKNVLKKQKAHYDLRSYSELGKDDTGKNAKVYDRCLSGAIPLIASASIIYVAEGTK